MQQPTSATPAVVMFLVLCVTLLAGCSDSGDSGLVNAGSPDSGTTDSQPVSEAAPAEGTDTAGAPAADGGNEAMNDGAATAPPPVSEGETTTQDEPDAGNTGTAASDPEVADPEDFDPAVPDPLTHSSIRVEFQISVPAYQSDALRVRLDWGDVDVTASWVGDEIWSASTELPADTRHSLRVTFYDDNGALELAVAERAYRTGTNASETVRITTDQFDADPFDTDQDGVSNLDEVRAGTNPTIDEDALLDIADSFPMYPNSRMSVSEEFESQLTDARPLLLATEYRPAEYVSSVLNVDIDRLGNGTLTHVHDIGCESQRLSGTRTYSDNAVTWDATRSAYDCDYGHRVAVTNTISVVDAQMRSFVMQLVGSNVGTYRFTWDTTAEITARLVDGTSVCEPVAGTLIHTYRENRIGDEDSVTVTTLSKTVDDPYWRRVQRIETFPEYNPSEGETQTSESFVRTLHTGRNPSDPDAPFFLCDFVDFED